MIGTIVVALQMLLFWGCWNLNKTLQQQHQEGKEIPLLPFVICSIVNLLALTPVCWLIFTLPSLLFFKREDDAMIMGGIIATIVVIIFIIYQYHKYKPKGLYYKSPITNLFKTKKSMKQESLLYYCANHLSFNTPNSKSLLDHYREQLKLDYNDFVFDMIALDKLPFEDVIKGLSEVKDNGQKIAFLQTCTYLIDKTESYISEEEFLKILDVMGINIDNLRKIMQYIEVGDIDHFYDREVPSWDIDDGYDDCGYMPITEYAKEHGMTVEEVPKIKEK